MTLFALPVASYTDTPAGPARLTHLTPKSWQRIELAPSRAGAHMRELQIADEDVVALQLEGGFRLWLRGDDLRAEAGHAPTRDGGPWRLAAGTWSSTPVPCPAGRRGRGASSCLSAAPRSAISPISPTIAPRRGSWLR